MKRVKIEVEAEDSRRLFAMLVGSGIKADLVSRGSEGDVIRVPRKDAPRALRLMRR